MRQNLFLISTILLIGLSRCNNEKTLDDIKGVKATFKENAALEVRNAVIGTVRAGETVEVIAEEFLAFQIKKKNGDIGWVKKKYMPVGKTAQIGYRKKMGSRALYSEAVYNPYNADDKIILEMDRSYDEQQVTVLRDMILSERHWAEIKLPDGKTGWTLVDYLIPFGKLDESQSEARYRGGNLWLYTLEILQKKAAGKDSGWLMNKFGFPSGKVAKMATGNNEAWYFENIELYRGKSAGRVVYFELKDEKIIHVDLADSPQGRIAAWLPLSKMVRNFGFGNTYRNLPNLLTGLDKFFGEDGPIDKILPGILYWPFYIILIILVLGIGLVYTMLPIVAVTLFVSIRSLNKKVSTSSLVLIQGILGVLLGHLWFLFLIYHDAYFYLEPFLAILFLPIIGSLVIAYMMKTLEYNRCPNCNYWSGLGIGSIWLSRSTRTQTTTTDTYRGDEHVGTSVKTETKITDRFKDLRVCKNCGHEWSIIREVDK
ncbi:MAG: SH3 domain-containing protein [Candidatus Marinimicrobia bacterium]|nr:SH3 domain-containing protein [Candidatus Neomarinimicrobiota bacterium]